MPITRTPIVDDDGTGTTGTVLDNAWKQQLYDQIDALVGTMGTWVNVPFNAANFSGVNAMTFTVSAGTVTWNRYAIVGKTLIWLLYIQGATIGGTPDIALFVTLPAGFAGAALRGVAPTTQCYDGAYHRGWVRVDPSSGSRLMIQQDPPTAFTVNAGSTYIQFVITMEIN